jgi:cytochrome c biogenesis protein CcdA
VAVVEKIPGFLFGLLSVFGIPALCIFGVRYLIPDNRLLANILGMVVAIYALLEGHHFMKNDDGSDHG